ncbi:hypothetical protein [Pontibacter harenae]|uniref:hypothetical protein n=1 Tax=Pontibacter harenae TaxID=2894083 RepID=UPI001E5BBE31|nr:hypothetical protein [Pontibacter harenae]MCC9166017.1 hypothetical protein [Pontibacter harenae]
MEYVSLWPILLLALIHFFGNRLTFLSAMPRSVWLSGAGGVSVAYVFLHLFPELDEGQEHVETLAWAEGFLRHHVYLVALTGLAVFYGLERLVISSKNEAIADEEDDGEKPSFGAFLVHIGSFAFYNALIGYLLFQREEGPVEEMALFSIAMALHFIVNDVGLLTYHKDNYERFGRWVLVVALVLGWGVGYVLEVSETIVVLVMAFIGGGVILNIMKEELPEERKSRFWAFGLGVAAYSVLLLSI